MQPPSRAIGCDTPSGPQASLDAWRRSFRERHVTPPLQLLVQASGVQSEPKAPEMRKPSKPKHTHKTLEWSSVVCAQQGLCHTNSQAHSVPTSKPLKLPKKVASFAVAQTEASISPNLTSQQVLVASQEVHSPHSASMQAPEGNYFETCKASI